MSQITPPVLFDCLRFNSTPRIYECEPGWRWSPPPLPDYDLWCVLNGEGVLDVDGQTFALGSGVCFVLPPGSAPRASQNAARRLTVLYAHFEAALFLPPLLGVIVRDTAALHVLAARLCQTAQRAGTDGANRRQPVVLLESLLWLLHDEKNAPRESPADVLVRRVAAQMEAAPGDDWAIDRQARLAHLSRSQYGRRFRALFDCSPADWVVDTRLTRAAQLLRETTMPIGEIARVLGYRDVFYFSRQFKLKNNVAPSHLRQK